MIQGITEWIPISSEAMVILAKVHLFGGRGTVSELVLYSLALHLGTFFSALIYLRRDVGRLAVSVVRWRQADTGTRNLFGFLLVACALSGGIGIVLLGLLSHMQVVEAAGRWVTGGIGGLLIVTGAMQLYPPREGTKGAADLTWWGEGPLLGIAQGLAALPGFSRSGLTVSALLLRQFNKEDALRFSFLMGLPVLLAPLFFGREFAHMLLKPEILFGMAVSAVTGFAAIAALMRIARRVNF
ncbi:MAG: hypothetical protein COV76_06310, partial [Candidatus Omnitrophica bacterium CG11_big_fil_rev_8_21_14_0_20_64_10]